MKRLQFVTLSRSDYASTRPIVLAAQEESDFEVRMIAGGSHLLKRFGETLEEVQDDFPDLILLDFLDEKDDSAQDLARAFARAFECMVSALSSIPIDLVFIVGDRWEMLAVASAASMLRIPIAHHSGGDVTQGSADNQIRYTLSALSHLHFVALEDHRRRLLSMGEEEWRVYVSGEPALLGLKGLSENLTNPRVELGLGDSEPFVLATFHPTSYENSSFEEQIKIFIAALELIDSTVVLTAPNPDQHSGHFFKSLSDYASRRPRVHLFESLGSELYYAAMTEARFMIGNSSSGIWEAPSLGLPVVNIGCRQDGRVRAGNVVDASLCIDEISVAIRQVTGSGFREKLLGIENPYFKDDSIERILSVLREPYTREKLLAKKFVDPLKLRCDG